MIIELNGLTKKAQKMIKNYDISTIRDIYEAYERPSWRKVKSFHDIEDDMKNEVDGYDLKICGWNSSTYTAAYRRVFNGLTQLLYYTPQNLYIIDLSPEVLLLYELEKDNL